MTRPTGAQSNVPLSTAAVRRQADQGQPAPGDPSLNQAQPQPMIETVPAPPADETPFDSVYFEGEPYADGQPCSSPSWWWGADYLVWWTHAMDSPPLATTGSATDTLPAALGQPGTRVLFGGGLNDDARSGGRFTLGAWLDSCHTRGFEVIYLTLDGDEMNFHATEADFSVLGRPFFNSATHAQDARLIADPDAVSGSLDIQTSTDFDTLEVLYRQACLDSQCVQFDLLLGYRYAELDDRVRVDESTLSLAGATAGTTFDLVDRFATENTFHGAEIGLVMKRRANACWSWETVAKLAVGGSDHRADVSGRTTITDSLAETTVNPGGLLTQPTNIGDYRWDDVTTIWEFGLMLHRELRCGLAFHFGYSLVYWNDVARAGRQIDPVVNPTQIPPSNLVGPARPEFPKRVAGFWAQGLTFGLEYNY